MTPKQIANLERIIARGGTVHMHPDTLDDFRQRFPVAMATASYIGVQIFANKFIPKGQIIAMEKSKPFLLTAAPFVYDFDDEVSIPKDDDEVSIPKDFTPNGEWEPEPWDTFMDDSDDPWMDLIIFSVLTIALDTHGLRREQAERHRTFRMGDRSEPMREVVPGVWLHGGEELGRK